MKLFCPIRGELNVNEKAKDGITYTEEFRRIECIKILLNLGYPKELFKMEDKVWDVGNSGRNRIMADIVVFSDKDKTRRAIIAAIKRDHRDKKSAIEHQLNPSLIHCDSDYGIYYDGIENVFFSKSDGYKEEHSLLKFPKFGFKFEEKPLMFSDLMKLENIHSIIDKIEQILHNMGTTKEEKYREFFKLILCKYFDERDKIDTNEILEFQLQDNLDIKIKNLYEKARNYYGTELDKGNLKINGEALKKSISLLQNYSLLISRQDILQALFMKFAQSTLKTELAQFYTPIDIVEFIVGLCKIGNTTKIIDPAGGSADFLIGALKKNIKSAQNIFYWDVSENAKEVAKLNMILNGDGRTNISLKDSILDFDSNNGEFDLVITNPPFGEDTIFDKDDSILENYNLSSLFLGTNSGVSKIAKNRHKRLGILFIERSLKLLKNGGILCIVLPNGYLTNPSDSPIRKYLLENFHIIASISLPEGCFKASDTGVKPCILIVKKEKVEETVDYKIFTAVANHIGFNYKSKKLERLFEVNMENGEFFIDEDNHFIPLSDFPDITKQFLNFIYESGNISGFESENTKVKYSSILKSELLKDSNLVLQAERAEKKYLNEINLIKSQHFLTLKNALISNEKDITKCNSNIYTYIDIGNLERGGYRIENILRGWELPNRAKISLKKDDICIAKLKGSLDKFAMILQKNTENLILTNGCYRIRFKDDIERLSFYHFLFTPRYLTQMSALASGSIMLDVKIDDLYKLVFPVLNDNELSKMKEFIAGQELVMDIKNELLKL